MVVIDTNTQPHVVTLLIRHHRSKLDSHFQTTRYQIRVSSSAKTSITTILTLLWHQRQINRIPLHVYCVIAMTKTRDVVTLATEWFLCCCRVRLLTVITLYAASRLRRRAKLPSPADAGGSGLRAGLHLAQGWGLTTPRAQQSGSRLVTQLLLPVLL